MKRDPLLWLTVVLIGCMGVMALGELWEQDIFWQIRAGAEFLASWSFPHEESWSFTSAGQPWYNFQWFATLIIAAMHRIAGIPGLIVLRMLFALAILATVAMTLSVQLATPKKWPAILLTLALVAVASSARTQMRPDFMMLLPYSLLGLLWARPAGMRRTWISSLLLVLIAANMHPGTALFAVAYAMLLAFQPLKGPRLRIFFGLSCLAAWSMTPYLWEMPGYLKRHIFYAASTFQNNPDHAPLLVTDFTQTEQGLYAWAFLLATLTAAITLCRPFIKSKRPAFISYETLALAAGLALVAMTINRQRTIPYAVILMAPFIAKGLLWLWRGFGEKGARLAAVTAAALLVTVHCATDEHPLGLRLNTYMYPMDCIHFIQRHEPMGQLLHVNRWGDVVLGLLPHYKVSTDSREMPFDHLGSLLVQDIYNQPKLMAGFIERYGVNAVLLPLDFFQLPMHSADLPWSRRITFFPLDKWAVVAYDNQGMLLIRRIPQHAALIETYGFHLAIPDVPPDFYLRDKGRSPTSDALFVGEVSRCLKDMPTADYCAMLHARWLRQDNSPGGRTLARQFVKERLSQEPKNSNMRAELELIDR